MGSLSAHFFLVLVVQRYPNSQLRVMSEVSLAPAGVSIYLGRLTISLLIPTSQHLISHKAGNAMLSGFHDNLCSLNFLWVFA